MQADTPIRVTDSSAISFFPMTPAPGTRSFEMIEKLRSLFEPRYPQRYIGRHRIRPTYPVITITLRRPA